MSEWLFPLLAGAVTGVLSGFGVGGGTLLLVYMTVFAGLDQHLAQLKNGYVAKPVLLPAIGAGLALAALAAWAATALDVEVLRKCFGAFLIIAGAMELFGKARA